MMIAKPLTLKCLEQVADALRAKEEAERMDRALRDMTTFAPTVYSSKRLFATVSKFLELHCPEENSDVALSALQWYRLAKLRFDAHVAEILEQASQSMKTVWMSWAQAEYGRWK